MCTVTFLPLGDRNFVLTSNRDVGYKRAKAEPPHETVEEGVTLLYPKDGKAGGTWIGSSRDNRLICLLNGGFENHVQQESYRKSRGLIVKEILIAEDLEDILLTIDLDGIEPFTLVIVEWREELRLSQFVWDGVKRFNEDLDLAPRIWSSSTLFDPEMRQTRNNWFESWKETKPGNPEAILEFHKNAGAGNNEVGVILKRERVGTVSITQFVKQGKTQMTYREIP